MKFQKIKKVLKIESISRRAFLIAYMTHVGDLPWAKDNPEQLKSFMKNVVFFLDGNTDNWDWQGRLAKQTWVELGGKLSQYTKKNLRLLS
jgi:hypothetical protein